jgi:hypothetical protein
MVDRNLGVDSKADDPEDIEVRALGHNRDAGW